MIRLIHNRRKQDATGGAFCHVGGRKPEDADCAPGLVGNNNMRTEENQPDGGGFCWLGYSGMNTMRLW